MNDTAADTSGNSSVASKPTCRRVEAAEWRRKLDASRNEAGSSEAHIFADIDGIEYLVKATNNPQAGKVVVNELVSGLALEWLGVLRPPTAIVTVPLALIAASPGAKFNNGQSFGDGEAFGSAYWVSEAPQSVPVTAIENLRDVAGSLVLDGWFNNCDSRQWRGRLKQVGPGKATYEFFPVDRGHCISHSWDANLQVGDVNLRDAPFHIDAGKLPEMEAHMEEYAKRLTAFSSADARHLVSEVPASWLAAAERTALTTFMEQRAPKTVTAIRTKYPSRAPTP
jgi:hypothetical protein